MVGVPGITTWIIALAQPAVSAGAKGSDPPHHRPLAPERTRYVANSTDASLGVCALIDLTACRSEQ